MDSNRLSIDNEYVTYTTILYAYCSVLWRPSRKEKQSVRRLEESETGKLVDDVKREILTIFAWNGVDFSINFHAR